MGPRQVSVIELAAYRRRADELLTAGEQDAVIDLIAYDPTCGDLIPGTPLAAPSPRARGEGWGEGASTHAWRKRNEDAFGSATAKKFNTR